jgi:hypothetical protein
VVTKEQLGGVGAVNRPFVWRWRWLIGLDLTILGTPAMFCWVWVGYGGEPGYVAIGAALLALASAIPMFFVYSFLLPRWPKTVISIALFVSILATAKAATFPTFPEGTLGYISAWQVAVASAPLVGTLTLVAVRHTSNRGQRPVGGKSAN